MPPRGAESFTGHLGLLCHPECEEGVTRQHRRLQSREGPLEKRQSKRSEACGSSMSLGYVIDQVLLTSFLHSTHIDPVLGVQLQR